MVDWIKITYVTRTLTFISAAALLGLSIFEFIKIILGIREIAQNVGYIIFAIKIILCELRLKFMLRNFPYMASEIGKALFILFCGSLLLSSDFSVKTIIGIAMIFVSILLFVIGLCARKKSDDQYFD